MPRCLSLLSALVFSIAALPVLPVAAAVLFDETGSDRSTIDEMFVGSEEAGEALSFIQSGKPDQALAVLETALEAEPDDAALHELQGLALGQLGQLDESLEAFNLSLILAPDRTTALIHRGILRLSMGDGVTGQADLEAAIALGSQDRRAHQRLGLIALAQGDASAAMTHLEAGLKGTPETYLGNKPELAILYQQADRHHDAIALLVPWRAKEETPDIVLEILATSMLATDTPDTAREIYTELSARGTSLDGLVGLAQFQVAEGAFDAAAQTLERAQEKFPDVPAVYFERGNLAGLQAHYAEAREIFESGLALDPENLPLTRAQSRTEYRLEHFDDALALAERAVTLSSSSASDILWQAVIQEKTGKLPEARASYEQIVALDPDNWVALNNLASLLTDSEAERAVELAQKANALSSGTPAVRDTLGWAYFAAGQPDAAKTIYEDLLEQAPEDPVVLYRHGRVLIELGEKSRGRDTIAKAIDLDPSFKYASEARRILDES
ncbi:tetratricopeptide repeat protein [Tropicimonas sp. TH_r6]|uniref:tetratricopeptide repeat protein n=1 Tax=Tropicimonas sp. TH_r6 TaxID=3082085 RepID=UPI002953BCE1|nr:tetratricopeptide repeat protein [Tropicimonas sp. TH_r6]MDV7145551.1 tetratricopeptide repeat protein [Tropicimonas sp. TH_r6]